MADNKLTRREFVCDSAVAAAGAAVGLTATKTVHAGNPANEDTSKILNYNPDMEYRRCGKTDLMVSAVCLGGHWKRVDKVVPEKAGRPRLAGRRRRRSRVRRRTAATSSAAASSAASTTSTPAGATR